MLFFTSCEKEKGEFPCVTRSPGVISVQVKNNVFDPATVNAVPGDTIKWAWMQGYHTATSTSVPSGASAFDGKVDPDSTLFQYVVPMLGTYNYFCKIHGSGMSGTIIVSECQ